MTASYEIWERGAFNRSRPLHRPRCLPPYPPKATWEVVQMVTFYVASGGDDGVTGLDPQSPLATMETAERLARLAMTEGYVAHIVVYGDGP
jgi:hypothetical protein